MTITDLARQALTYYYQTGQLMDVPNDLPEELKRRAGAFVSLHEGGELRGCIGTTGPTKDSLAAEIISNTVAAATRDDRFAPVQKEENGRLEISVDVLSEPVPDSDTADYDPKNYGIIVEASDGRRGVLLPDLEGVDTVADQIAICREKGGIGPDEPLKLYQFEVERYEEQPTVLSGG